MDRRFSFEEITKSEIDQEILNLDSFKAWQESYLPTKIIKANSDIFTQVIHKELNRSLEVGSFPCTMKLDNVTLFYIKGNRSDKVNYLLASILLNISKVFERCVYKQISQFFEGILSKYQCSFRKGHSAQHYLIGLLEKWHKKVGQRHILEQYLLTFQKLLIVCRTILLLLS